MNKRISKKKQKQLFIKRFGRPPEPGEKMYGTNGFAVAVRLLQVRVWRPEELPEP